MISKPIFVATIKHWLSSPLIWIAVGLVFVGSIGSCVLGLLVAANQITEYQILSSNGDLLFAVILGTGIIGRDLSSGVLPLVFARPLSRANYVFSKWLTLSIAAIVLSLAQCLIIHLLFLIFSPATFSNQGLLVASADILFVSFGTAAVMILFSALKSGSFAGTGIWLLTLAIVVAMLQFGAHEPIAAGSHGANLGATVFNALIPVMSKTGNFLLPFLGNRASLAEIFQSGVDWLIITTYLSNLALALVLAIYVMNRRELTYASD